MKQVFTEEALQALGRLAKVQNASDGDQPKMMPLKSWPLDERSKTLKGILNLNYLNDNHREEWKTWFDSLTEVHVENYFHSLSINANV
jgi:hypothetical protein